MISQCDLPDLSLSLSLSLYVVVMMLCSDNARELFGAPVPLIAGTTSAPRISDVSSDTAILYLNDDNVVAHPASSSSSSAVDFKFVAWFIRLPEVSADMPFDVEICRRLDYTNALLTQYCMDRVEVKELSLYQHPPPTTGTLIDRTEASPHTAIHHACVSHRRCACSSRRPLTPPV